jgi:hypothetical protein
VSDAGRAPDTSNWNPEFAKRLAAFREALTKAGIQTTIQSGYRSPEYQNQMYQNHLAKYVTHTPLPFPNVEAPRVVAPPWRSFHNYGIATDMTPVNASDYPRMWDMANQFGLTALREKDRDHFQLSGTLDQNIRQYNLAGWRPETRPAPTEGALAYNGGPPAGQPPQSMVARGTTPAGDRPQYQSGIGTIGGLKFRWGSGHPGQSWSVPYGDYPVTPDAPTGAWAQSVGAIPIANNVIPDPLLHRDRTGIMIHSGSGDNLDALYTAGCFRVAQSDWPAVRAEILKETKSGPLYLHVQPGGMASFTNASTLQPVASIPTATAPPSTSASLRSASAPASTAPAGSPQAQHEAFIRDYATKVGVNPELALGIARAEGMNEVGFRTPNQASTVDVTAGQPWSFGDFQLNVRNGLGTMARQKGIDPADPKQWQAADMFAIDYMKSGGLAPWKGDKFATAWGSKPVMGTSLTSTPAQPEGIVDPSIHAHGGTSPPLPAKDGSTPATTVVAAPAAPTFGDSVAAGDVGGAIKAALTKPPSTKDAQGNPVEGKSPADRLA